MASLHIVTMQASAEGALRASGPTGLPLRAAPPQAVGLCSQCKAKSSKHTLLLQAACLIDHEGQCGFDAKATSSVQTLQAKCTLPKPHWPSWLIRRAA